MTTHKNFLAKNPSKYHCKATAHTFINKYLDTIPILINHNVTKISETDPNNIIPLNKFLRLSFLH
jgi:hypothetical protein